MSSSELKIVRLELSSNLLVPHVFSCRVLVFFASHTIFFPDTDEQANAFSEDWSENTAQKLKG